MSVAAPLSPAIYRLRMWLKNSLEQLTDQMQKAKKVPKELEMNLP